MIYIFSNFPNSWYWSVRQRGHHGIRHRSHRRRVYWHETPLVDAEGQAGFLMRRPQLKKEDYDQFVVYII